MTLSRGPYNELDKMSLFQDLKLKRRKVDSRCSSDGESLADTSTSSPDLIAPLSPKMCDAANQGNQTGTQQSSSASSNASATPPPSSTPPTPPDHNIHQLISVRRNLSVSPEHRLENPSTTSVENQNTKPNSTNGSHGGASVIIDNRPRSQSPAPSSPIRRSPISTLLHHHLQHSNVHDLHSQQHITVLVTPPRIKSENNLLMNAMTRKIPTSTAMEHNGPLPMTAPLSGLSQLHQHHQMHQVQIPYPPQSMSATPIYKRHPGGQMSPNNNYSPPSSQAQQQNNQFLQHRIKRERSPTQLTIIQSNHRQQAQMSPHHIPITTSSAGVMHGSPIQMRAQNMRDAAMLFRIKNEPQIQMSPGFMQHNPQQRMVWGPQARINGVKPEVIGGPLPPLRQQQSPQSSPQQTSPNQTPTNRTTPTVIMGESCGVRTMVWGFEPVMSSPPQAQQVQTPTPPIQTPPSTSQNSNHSSSSNHSSNNEEAAHLLLSLGQGARPMMDVS